MLRTKIVSTIWKENLDQNVLRPFVIWHTPVLIKGKSCSYVQSTPDNSNLQGKSKKVRVIGSSSYRPLEENSRE